MSSSLLFDIANFYTIPLWIAIIVLPNWKVTQKVMSSYLPWIPLILLYVYYLTISFINEAPLSLSNFNLAAIANFISQENAAGGAWTHFLVVDLFIARWIYWQGKEKNIWTIHSLILCTFVAPVGLLSHGITEWLSNNQNDDTERTEK